MELSGGDRARRRRTEYGKRSKQGKGFDMYLPTVHVSFQFFKANSLTETQTQAAAPASAKKSSVMSIILDADVAFVSICLVNGQGSKHRWRSGDEATVPSRVEIIGNHR